MTHYGHGHYGTLAYNVWTTTDSGSTKNCYERIIFDLRYLFYADNGNADAYVLPAEKLVGDERKGVKGWFDTYTEKYGGTKINDRYSKDLFDHVDDEFTEVNITANDEFKLSDVTTKKNWWSWLFGNEQIVIGSNDYNVSAIQKVVPKDFDDYAKAVFEDKFYVDESDYDELRQYVIESNAKNETVYLFRYYQSVYDSQEAREFEFVKDWAIARGTFGNYSELDTNAYIAQMWVQLDFDIIDLTFTKDNVSTIIPVVMNPIDIAADADHPIYVTDDTKGLAWWQILLAILLVILIIFLLWKFAPTILTVLIKIILFPFKLIGMVFKSISSATKPMREKNKLRRQERKAQRKLEREQRKERERQRKADEKQKQREDKIKRKEAERQRKREQKQMNKEKKREEKHDKKMRKQAERNYKDFEKYDEFPWCEERPMRKKKKKYSLAELDKMSDAELAEMYFETYGFDDADIPDDLFD